MPTEPAPQHHRWLCVSPAPDGGQRVVFVASARYPDGMRVELPARIADAQIGDDLVAEALLDDAGTVVILRVSVAAAPKAPEVWFAEVRESTARPPAVNLVVFTGAAQQPGTLLDAARLRALAALPSSPLDQLAALRWWPGTGEVDQVYVQPQWRRHSVGTLLVLAGSTLAQARGWARLWGDGQRTELGEQWRNAAAWRHRTDELTHEAPPMTPPP